MNPIFQMLLSGLVKYLESNPAQVDALVEQLITWILNSLKTQNMATKNG